MLQSKKEINDGRANEIARRLSDPKERKKLLVGMWFPLDRFKIAGETEDQRVERLYQQLVAEAEKREKKRNKHHESSHSKFKS